MTRRSTPRAEAVYAAEESLEDSAGPRLRRWSELESFVQRVIDDETTRDVFTTLPSRVDLMRRSRSATCSYAVPGTAEIAIRDGSWNAIVVCHEISHLIAAGDRDHGSTFAGTELWLVRRHCGFDAYVELRRNFDRHGVDYREAQWP